MKDLRLGISIGVSPREAIQRWVELVELIDDSGCHCLWVTDSQFAMKDAFSAMILAASRTRSMLIGPGVTNPLTRHVSVLASSIAALNEISSGRAIVGLGSGDSAVFPLGQQPAPRKLLEQFAAQLLSLLRGDEVDFGGGPISLGAQTEPVPLFIAASQPRMLELAGRIGDGVIVMGPSNPDVVRSQLSHVAEGARAAGRSLDDVAVDLWITLSASEERAQAFHDVRSWASAQARWLHRWERLPPSLQPHRDEIRATAEQYDFGDHLSLHAEHAYGLSDDLTGQLAVVGTAEECARQVAELAQEGVSQITVPLLSGGRRARLSVLTEKIWPLVRSELGLSATV